ncbi:MAG: excisionase family DNA-binding protein [Chloroflexota bacterium]|nr:excisionase family DNA-binding protein [Anaerolineae bacterium]HMM29685.1 excisionase family DNA-binding protein [Aggregatilineaceae bacterium]
MILWELALAAIGLYLLIGGRLSLMGRELRGRRAREIGLVLIAPLAIALLLALALSAALDGETAPDGAATPLTLVEIALVVAALGGAVALFGRENRAGSLFWRGAPPPPPRVDSPTPPGPGRMTVAEAARLLRLSDLEVLALIRAGTLTGVRAGSSYHVDRRSVDRLRLQRKDR